MNFENFTPKATTENPSYNLHEMTKGKSGPTLAIAVVAALSAGLSSNEAHADSFASEINQDAITTAFESGNQEKLDALLDNAPEAVKAAISELRDQVFNNLPETFVTQEPIASMRSESLIVTGEQESVLSVQDSVMPTEFTGQVAHFSSIAAFQNSTAQTVWSGHESRTFLNPTESDTTVEVTYKPAQTVSAGGMSVEEAIQTAVVESVRNAGMTIEHDQEATSSNTNDEFDDTYRNFTPTESIAYVSYRVIEQDVSEEGVAQVRVEVQIGTVETE